MKIDNLIITYYSEYKESR